MLHGKLAREDWIWKNKGIPSTISPYPCLLPARTILGGLSTMDMKFGSSAGCAFALRVVCDICRHAGHLGNKDARTAVAVKDDGLKLRACRSIEPGTFIMARYLLAFNVVRTSR